MPDQISNLEHSILEGDIARLAQEIRVAKERPETTNLNDQQVLKMALQSLAASSPPVHLPDSQSQSATLPAYLQNASSESKLEVEYLIDLALHQGLDKAHAQVKKTSPFIMDAFHDALTGKLYPEFQKRGLLE